MESKTINRRVLAIALVGCIVPLLSETLLWANERATASTLTRVPETFSSGTLLENVGITPRLGEKLPLDAEFTDSTGKKVRLGELLTDHPVVLHLVYYECPMLCKLSSDGLFKTLSTLSLEPGKDFSIVTLSFDAREGPELSAQARRMAIERCGEQTVERGWTFLTGEQESIDAVTSAVGFRYMFDERRREYAHAAGLYIITPDGTISRYLSGIDYSQRDLRLGLVEAGDGKVGTATDQVLLMCYMYDPTVGRYGLAILSAVRVAGVVTVCAMAAGIFVMLRRERNRDDSYLQGALTQDWEIPS